MRHESHHTVRVAGAIAVALLIALPGVLFAQIDRTVATSVSGVVQGVNRQLNYVTIRDDATGQNVKIDVRRLDTRQSVDVSQLRTGDRVSVDGAWQNRDTFQATRLNTSGIGNRSRRDVRSRMQRNGLTGVVENTNRRLNFLTVRDEATGRSVKVDVRRMDTRQSVNVWQLRPGDAVEVSGAWEKNDTFRADRIGPSTYSQPYSQQPAVSPGTSANAMNGVVENINRQLNYVTVRDEVTGRSVKVDMRQMDTRRSIDVWKLREGDRIIVNGRWGTRDTFEANTVNF